MTDFSSVPQLFLSPSAVRGRTKQSSIPQSWECLLFGGLSEEDFSPQRFPQSKWGFCHV
jgi:hypothetical protein